MKNIRLILYGWLWLATAWSMQAVAVAAPGDTASNVRLLGQIGGLITEVYVTDNQAYISEGRSVTMLDVSQPTLPKVLGRIKPLAEIIQGIVVQNHLAYVAAGSAGLYIFDVTDPAQPLRVGFYDTPGEAYGVFVANNYAYIADGASGLRILQVANPATISEVGFYDTPGSASSVYAVDHYAYIADGESGLRIIDVKNPAAAHEVGFANTPGWAVDVEVAGNYTYVGDLDGGLRVLNVTNQAAPSEVGFYDASWVVDISVVGNYAYLADTDSGLRVVDVSNPTAPTEVGFYGVRHVIEGADVAGNYAYVADWDGRLWVVDVSNPTTPTEVGFYSTPKRADAVHVAGDYAYVANGSDGLHILNVVDPLMPSKVGFSDSTKFPEDVFVAGVYAYVTGYEAPLRIIDVRNPISPIEVGSIVLAGSAYQSVYVVGNYAYVADGYNALRVINVENPTTPSEVGVYTSPGGAENVQIVESHAYLAGGQSGLRIVNINNPSAPSEVGFYDTSGSANALYVTGNYAYIADGESGLRIVNVTNLATPSEVGFYDTTGTAVDVYVAGKFAYVADGDYGLRVIDISNPATPKEVGSYSIPEFAARVHVANNVVYLATGTGGLYLLRYPDCYHLTLQYTGLGAIPTANPANSVNCSPNEYIPQAFVTLSANPAPGWRVASWNGTSNDSSTALNNTVTMPAADHAVRVNYAPVCYPLTLTHSGDGNHPSTSPANSTGCTSGQYVAGQVITLTAAPGVGSTVGGWSGTNNDSSTANANTLTMPAAGRVAGVSYVLACYSLTLTHTGSGSDPIATPEQSAGCLAGTYHFEESVTLSANPASGWQVSAWSGTTNNSSSSTSNTLLMPATAHTAVVHYGETPLTAPGDLYELDNSCTRSRTITTDGSEVQEHSFHAGGDVDWVRFDATANTKYRIEVTVPNTSTADVVMELYPDCTSAPLDQWTGGFSPGARLELSRTASNPTYVRLSNDNASVAGDQVRYTLSVRKLGEAPANRMLIIVAGRLKLNDSVQANIDKVATNVYKLFQRNGYSDDNIHLLASNANLPGYDGAASKASMQAAIQQAASKVINGVLTLYLVDHGTPELFYIDGVNEQTVTPSELNEWLTQLESTAPGVKINVIIEACEAGSFIDKPGSISKPGRVIITSTNADNDAKASKEGAYFSDHLLTWLQQGFNLSASFLEARTAAKGAYSLQEAWIDSNGNGLANEFDDGTLAAQRSFAYAGTLADNEWPPHIFAATTVGPISDQQVRLRVDARDNSGVRQVWAVLYAPTYTPPTPTQVLQPEVLPTFLFTRVDNDNHWEAEVTGLTQTGTYRLLIQADDEQGLVARPVTVEVNTAPQNEWKIFLPAIGR